MKTRIIILCILCASSVVLQAQSKSDLIIADFEGASYGEWKAEGKAFGTAPATGTLPGQMRVAGYTGKGLVNSFLGGDKPTGTLTSPPITVTRKYLTFLIGGGHTGKTCMNLLIDGKVVHSTTGANTRPGGSEELTPAFWDLSKQAGKTVTLQIVDAASGGWGTSTSITLCSPTASRSCPIWLAARRPSPSTNPTSSCRSRTAAKPKARFSSSSAIAKFATTG